MKLKYAESLTVAIISIVAFLFLALPSLYWVITNSWDKRNNPVVVVILIVLLGASAVISIKDLYKLRKK